jgi:hypothetical protein
MIHNSYLSLNKKVKKILNSIKLTVIHLVYMISWRVNDSFGFEVPILEIINRLKFPLH